MVISGELNSSSDSERCIIIISLYHSINSYSFLINNFLNCPTSYFAWSPQNLIMWIDFCRVVGGQVKPAARKDTPIPFKFKVPAPVKMNPPQQSQEKSVKPINGVSLNNHIHTMFIVFLLA